MKLTFFKIGALAIMLALGMSSHATSWRVNSNTTRGAHFADINAAMSSADVQDGDTLYLDPGCNLSSNQNVTKCVTIIGNGFFHDNGQPYGFSTISGQTNLKAAGCKIEGVVMTGNYVYVAANNVTIERCKVTGSYGIRSNGNNCKNAIIRNCYLENPRHAIQGQGQSSSYTAFWTIENNIINTSYYYNGNFNYESSINGLYSPMIRNNFIYCGAEGCLWYITNGTIINNIIINYRYKDGIIFDEIDCTMNNNIISAIESAIYPQNIYLDSNNLTTIFTMTGPNDQQYQLCENSPAKGYATDGGDCGPYGSGYTYVPGGLPLGLPYYTEVTIGSMAHDGKVNVTLKIAVQDE